MNEYTYSIDSAINPANGVSVVAHDNLDDTIRHDAVLSQFGLVGSSSSGDSLVVSFGGSLTPEGIAALDSVIWSHDGTPLEAEPERVQITNSKIDVSTYPPEASRVTIITHEYTDPTTWYTDSVFHDQYELVRKPDSDRVFTMPTTLVPEVDFNYGSSDKPGPYIVDMSHGKVSNEDFILTPEGGLYPPVILVNGELQKETTLEEPNGDYFIDYEKAELTFEKSVPGNFVVTGSYYVARGSHFYLKPLPGKILEISNVEIQFSVDVSVRDTLEFKTLGMFGALSPSDQAKLAAIIGMTPPPETIVQLKMPIRYKSMMDFINEANGAYPYIPSSKAPKLTERDLHKDVITYPWYYQAVVAVPSSVGACVQIKLLHDRPYYGERGVATFYCLSKDDPNYQS